MKSEEEARVSTKVEALVDSVPFARTRTSASSVPWPRGAAGATTVSSVAVAARTSAGWPENVTTVPAGAGSKPRPETISLSPAWPLWGEAPITRGSRPSVSSIGLVTSLPTCTPTCDFSPSAAGTAGTTTRTWSGWASLISAGSPPITTESGVPLRFCPLIRSTSPGMATSGSRAVILGAR